MRDINFNNAYDLQKPLKMLNHLNLQQQRMLKYTCRRLVCQLSIQILDESQSKYYVHCIYQLNSFLYPKLTFISVHISFSVNDHQHGNEIKNMAQSSTRRNTSILLFIRLFLNKTSLLFGRQYTVNTCNSSGIHH